MNRRYRKTIIAGNWKMNNTITQTKEFVEKIKPIMPKGKWCTVVLCVPATNITSAVRLFKDCHIAIGAETCHYEDHGAFTGEISLPMLCEIGVKAVIVGHSERRQYFGETDETVNRKTAAALAAGLTPVVCIGETLPQREAGGYLDFLAGQLRAALSGLAAQQVEKAVIAYEPVWAIGTGVTASDEQAEEVCAMLRRQLERDYGEVADRVSILYGGSMNADNAASLLQKQNIDGGLIGGASLKPADFAKIVEAANAVKGEPV